jgi:hypothetical protein
MELKGVFKESTWPDRQRFTFLVNKSSITNDSDQITFSGQLSHRTVEDVQGLKIKNQSNLQRFPRGLGSVFPRLKAVEISGCDLEKLSKEDLAGLEDLEVLILESNQISSLDDDLFENNRKLTHISFRNNKLGKMTSKLFDPIPRDQLMYLDFLENLDIKAIYNRNQEGTVSLNELMEHIDDISLHKSAFDVDLSDSQVVSDDTVQIDGNQMISINGYSVYKEIAVDQSPVLAVGIEEGVSEFQLEGFCDSAIENLLNYLGEMQLSNDDDICGTLKLATQLQITKLSEMTIRLLEKSFNDDNVLEILKFAAEFNMDALEEAALRKVRAMIWWEIPQSIETEDLLKMLQIDMERKAKIEQVKRAAGGRFGETLKKKVKFADAQNEE